MEKHEGNRSQLGAAWPSPHGIMLAMEYLVLSEYLVSGHLNTVKLRIVINQSLGMLRERDFAMQTLTNKFISDQMLI